MAWQVVIAGELDYDQLVVALVFGRDASSPGAWAARPTLERDQAP